MTLKTRSVDIYICLFTKKPVFTILTTSVTVTHPPAPHSLRQCSALSSRQWTLSAWRDLLNLVKCDRELTWPSSLSTTVNYNKSTLLEENVCSHQGTQTSYCQQLQSLSWQKNLFCPQKWMKMVKVFKRQTLICNQTNEGMNRLSNLEDSLGLISRKRFKPLPSRSWMRDFFNGFWYYTNLNVN